MHNGTEQRRQRDARANCARLLAVSSLLFGTVAGVCLAAGTRPASAASFMDGVVNSYYPVTAVSGTTLTLDLGGQRGAAHSLAPGDSVMLIQMTGDPAVRSGSNMGNYDVTTVVSASGSTLVLTALTRSYSPATEKVQVVWMPSDDIITVNVPGVQPYPWDGTVGGVVGLAGGDLVLDGSIDASAAGFTNAFGPGGSVDSSGPLGAGSAVGRGFPGGWSLGPGGPGGGGIAGGGVESTPGNLDSVGGNPGQGGRPAGADQPAPGVDGVNSTRTPGFSEDFYGTAHGASGGGGVTGGGGGGGGWLSGGGGGGTAGGGSGSGDTYSDPRAGGGGGSGGVGQGGDGVAGGPAQFDPSGECPLVDRVQCAEGSAGAGGGSYGGGGGAGSNWWGGDDGASGGGGGSWSGGGAGGVAANSPEGPYGAGGDGNAPVPAEIPDSLHFLNDMNPRLMMGGAGGAGSQMSDFVPLPGGAGGAIVYLDFTGAVSGVGSVTARGEDGASPTDGGRSGAGGGGGGQMRLRVGVIANPITISAPGGVGGTPAAGEYHAGTSGGGGGGGGIWVETTNAPDECGLSPDLPNVSFEVDGGIAGPSVINPKNGYTTASAGAGGAGLVCTESLEYDLALIKTTTSSSPVQPGAGVTWSITVANQGEVPSGLFTVTDAVPGGMTFVSASDGGAETAPGSGVVAWDLGGLDPGGTITVTLTASVTDVMLAPYRNWAEISSDSGDDVDSTPDTDTGSDPDGGFGVNPNDEAANHDSPAFDSNAETPLPSSELDEDDNDLSDVDVEVAYDLALDKVVVNASPVASSETVTWQVRVENQGNVPSGAFSVTDTLPTGMAFLSASHGGIASGRTVTWAGLSSLEPGEAVILTVSVSITEVRGDDYRNWAEVSADSADDYDIPGVRDVEDVDSTPDDNTGADQTLPNDDIDEDDNDDALVRVVVVYDMALIKSLPSGQRYRVGDNISFNIIVKNQGNADSGPLTVQDVIPDGLTFVSADSDGLAAGQVVTWTIPNLTPGETRTVTLVVRMSNATLPGYLNYAEIVTDSAGGYGPGVHDEDSTPDADITNDPIVDHDDVDTDQVQADEDDHDRAQLDPVKVRSDNTTIRIPATGSDAGRALRWGAALLIGGLLFAQVGRRRRGSRARIGRT